MYKLEDIAINDTIITKDNSIGKVTQINSIEYLNYKEEVNAMSKYIQSTGEHSIKSIHERRPFKSYNTIILHVAHDGIRPYHIAIDLHDIKKLIKPKKNIFTKIFSFIR